MNLELLDPFGRQVPDRIDATLQLPVSQKGAATALSFNRRGTYLAVGYADGTVAVHSTLNRTLTAVYHRVCTTSVSSISWSRRSRRLLVGAVGDATVRLIDTTHPSGSEVAAERLVSLASSKSFKDYDPDGGSTSRMDVSERTDAGASNNNNNMLSSLSSNVILPQHAFFHTEKTSFQDLENRNVVFVRESRRLGERSGSTPQSYKEPKQFTSVTIPLPAPLGHALQLHPDGIHGLAVCDGNLSIVRVLTELFCEAYQPADADSLWLPLRVAANDATDDIACAVFGEDNRSILAARPMELVIFTNIFGNGNKQGESVHKIPTDCSDPWHLIRHRQKLLLNGGDGILRLYDTASIPSSLQPGPVVQFQDSVTKTKFADASISGDGEHVVAVVNGDTLYEMYIWNALSGVLSTS